MGTVQKTCRVVCKLLSRTVYEPVVLGCMTFQPSLMPRNVLIAQHVSSLWRNYLKTHRVSQKKMYLTFFLIFSLQLSFKTFFFRELRPKSEQKCIQVFMLGASKCPILTRIGMYRRI